MRATLRDDAATIWSAAIDAVRPERLVAARLSVGPAGPGGLAGLLVDGRALVPDVSPGPGGRIVVVGGGKAAGGLAAGVAAILAAGPAVWPRPKGLVSVPEGCGVPPGAAGEIEIRATRPPAVNLPTPAVAAATREMLDILAGLGPADLAIALVTGGGSALLAAPPPGVPLEEKIAVTRFLSAAGGTIDEVNAVRRAASLVKAGGLARACGAGRLLVLVLSDVIGDPLETIASGPCMPAPPSPRRALAVLERFGVVAAGLAPRLVAGIVARAESAPSNKAVADREDGAAADGEWTTPRGCRVTHLLLGTNATAVQAASAAARSLGYRLEPVDAAAAAEGTADEVGPRLAAAAVDLSRRAAADGLPRAVVAGGEATVRVPADHGRGGRNQQTVLAAVAAARDAGWPEHVAVASIGTDGEDGPTDAAGGCVDAAVARCLLADPAALDRALRRCDAHDILAAAGGLVRTGPTGTNVADVRIVLARP